MVSSHHAVKGETIKRKSALVKRPKMEILVILLVIVLVRILVRIVLLTVLITVVGILLL